VVECPRWELNPHHLIPGAPLVEDDLQGLECLVSGVGYVLIWVSIDIVVLRFADVGHRFLTEHRVMKKETDVQVQVELES
jgi:hypothetical protein